MALISWPASLPQAPQFDSYSSQFESAVIRTRMDVGPPKQRRRSTVIFERQVMTFPVTKVQLQTFRTFFETTSRLGVIPFEFVNPDTDLIAQDYQFVADTQPVTTNQGGDLWVISVLVEKLP